MDRNATVVRKETSLSEPQSTEDTRGFSSSTELEESHASVVDELSLKMKTSADVNANVAADSATDNTTNKPKEGSTYVEAATPADLLHYDLADAQPVYHLADAQPVYDLADVPTENTEAENQKDRANSLRLYDEVPAEGFQGSDNATYDDVASANQGKSSTFNILFLVLEVVHYIYLQLMWCKYRIILTHKAMQM